MDKDTDEGTLLSSRPMNSFSGIPDVSHLINERQENTFCK